MAIDVEGNLYATTGLHRRRGTHETLDTKCGVHVIAPAGKLLPHDSCSRINHKYGFGENRSQEALYITAGKTFFRFRTESWA